MSLRYQIPTRLQTEDTVLTIGSLALTMRQSLILFVAGCLALECWHRLSPLQSFGWVGFVVRLLLAALPVLLALVIAMTRVRGRYAEQWAVLLGRYWRLPKSVVWSAIPIETPNVHERRPQ